MTLPKLAIDALLFKYQAEMKDATYVLSNYLNNPVAVGEHQTYLKRWIKLSINMLKRMKNLLHL